MNTFFDTSQPSIKYLIIFLLISGPLIGYAQTVDSIPQNLFDLLYQEEPLNLVLQTDMALLKGDKKSESYQKGQLTSFDEDQQISRTLRIKFRGRSRRMICDFPPLKLKFDKKKLRAEGLIDINEFKLVSHCFDGQTINQQLIREHLVYKMYNLLTPISFRVQLAQFHYIDSEATLSKISAYGFLIEPNQLLAKRLEGELCDTFGLDFLTFDQEDVALFSLFQFMVGNTDWDLLVQRNLKVLQQDMDTTALLVPYDFDQSAMVNAPYASPNWDVGQLNIFERCYMGPTEDLSALQTTLQLFQDKKSALYELCETETLLSPKSKKEMTRYLNSFYRMIDKPKRFKKAIRRNRRK